MPCHVAAPIGTIVDHEQDQGVFQQIHGCQSLSQFANILIYIIDHGENTRAFVQVCVLGKPMTFALRKLVVRKIPGFVILVLFLRHIMKRAVGCVGSNVSKEGFAGVLGRLDPSQGCSEEDVGTEPLCLYE